MQAKLTCSALTALLLSACSSTTNTAKTGAAVFKDDKAQTNSELYSKPAKGTITRWFSPENPTGAKGKGGITNKGAKGNAFFIVQPGATQNILQAEGAGIIQRMWMSGSIAVTPEQRRGVVINMYWDGEDKPAVSAPIADFFGNALGEMTRFDSELFSNPEGRSFNFTIPMPFRDGAKIEIVNESSSQVLFWYDINMVQVDALPDDAMYFHAHWRRDHQTELAKDFEILPKVQGTGRFIGTNVGIIGSAGYDESWFGEGEVKIYLDGDNELPSLVGTGTEDYIGTGWGQGEYIGQQFGSMITDTDHNLHTLYRYHIKDAVYFHEDIKVTVQQMGHVHQDVLAKIRDDGMPVIPVWSADTKGLRMGDPGGEPIEHLRFLDDDSLDPYERKGWGVNYYRTDDVSATSYFYLDSPVSNLPPLQPLEARMRDMQEKVWTLLEAKKKKLSEREKRDIKRHEAFEKAQAEKALAEKTE
ncbi:DUF2961 domain-containing protein [Porticoccus sp. W117]|uniref:glycoside hydrolase family 172 protein n=1 Tax=Porticoccus sp. W117 TaxID=3054777 RepID=UPI0025987416|nr:glycoside hydrolase family 172 protein [Porticoccus sp. W117]MDM3870063.1 DUF2961 domain-containing protein [Porticoccus sp. W117]